MYVCMYVCQHFQTSSPQKPLDRSKSNFIWSLHGMGGMKDCSTGPGHMTKMIAMPIYDKDLKKISFSGTKRPMVMKLGMHHRVLEYYQVCSNDDPGLTFSSETTGPIKSCFIWSFYGMGEHIFAQTVLVTWPRWPPCPYMVKTLKILLLWNQKADGLETWYASWGARVLPSSLKWWPWVDLDLFYSKVKFGPLCFIWEKKVNNGFFRNCHLRFETSNRWLKWQEVSADIKTLSPGGCMPTAPWYIHVLNHEKDCIKSDFKEISLKLATNG